MFFYGTQCTLVWFVDASSHLEFSFTQIDTEDPEKVFGLAMKFRPDKSFAGECKTFAASLWAYTHSCFSGCCPLWCSTSHVRAVVTVLYLWIPDIMPQHKMPQHKMPRTKSPGQNATMLEYSTYEGRSKSFEPDYLPLDFWAKKCYWP